ncbi:class I SAM-dependent methyltransferase [Sphingomonas desiccabilis]|nr:class I SAM-dependent methyltransferase [Sphingomonas desiccabilis]MBB3911825.1 SAM-dependent methyltransferase [Sphingomonas desiccabilis]
MPGTVLAAAKLVRRGLPALIDQARDRTDLLMLEARLGPVDLHLAHVRMLRGTGLHARTYLDWRARRIEKMLEIYGLDFFAGKRLLELGCGHGDIGAFFAEISADVLCVDGRIRNINFARLKHRRTPRLTFQVLDLEQDFSFLGHFDLIIDFGLLYHLRHVDSHLACCFGMADEIVLETVVCDSLDPHHILLRDECVDVDEEALNGTGSRPSPFYVERLAVEAGLEVERHFSADLNSADHFRYDWVHRDDGASNDDFGNRRFWRFFRKPVAQSSIEASGAALSAPAQVGGSGFGS